MNRCKVCKANTKPVVNFGHMPIANAFITSSKDKEYSFNLAVEFCPKCYMVQLKETVPPEKMFHDDYQFVSSTSDVMINHFKETAEEILEFVSDTKDPFVVELGSNDGVMLKHIAKAKVRHLGVEPSSNVAKMSHKFGVKTTEKFFNQDTAQEILEKYGPATTISGANVFCHIEDINSVFEGMALLLDDDGMIFFEEPYMLAIAQKTSFDQMYDEHVYFYSGLSIRELAKRHGLELVKMQDLPFHGGSMRYYLKKGAKNKVDTSVAHWIGLEKKHNLDLYDGYKHFQTKVDQICNDLKQTLTELKNKGERVVGYGATSKSTTTLNYAKIGPDLLEYITDNTPNKIGKFTPGTHIPIKDHQQFLDDDHNYTLLLAWNHKDEIIKKELDYKKRGGKFITYFPEVRVE